MTLLIFFAGLFLLALLQFFAFPKILQSLSTSFKEFSTFKKFSFIFILLIFNSTYFILFIDFPLPQIFKLYFLAIFFIPSFILFLLLVYVLIVTLCSSLIAKTGQLKHAGHGKSKIKLAIHLVLLLLLIVLGFIGTIYTRTDVETTHYELKFKRLPEGLSGLKIVQLSDLHLGLFFTQSDFDKVIISVLEQKPDIVFFTGDAISYHCDYIAEVAESLRRLKAPLGVFAVMGNHDYICGYQPFLKAYNKAGIILLKNEASVIPFSNIKARLNIVGVDDAWSYHLGGDGIKLDQALKATSPEDFTILLAHQPSIFDKVHDLPIDLVLSGHTHGGQIAFPGELGRTLSPARLVTPYVYGLYTYEDQMLYVNRGLGTAGPPLRLFVKPEITVFTLVHSND